jgi:hypothetical protein
MRIVRNLVKYTLGLPILLLFTIIILSAHSMCLILNIFLEIGGIEELIEDLKYIWKPIK